MVNNSLPRGLRINSETTSDVLHQKITVLIWFSCCWTSLSNEELLHGSSCYIYKLYNHLTGYKSSVCMLLPMVCLGSRSSVWPQSKVCKPRPYLTNLYKINFLLNRIRHRMDVHVYRVPMRQCWFFRHVANYYSDTIAEMDFLLAKEQ